MGGSPNPLAKLQDLLNGTLSHYRGIRLPNAAQDFCQWCIGLNELKWAHMTLNKLKMSPNEPTWDQMHLNKQNLPLGEG